MNDSYEDVVKKLADLDVQYSNLHREWRIQKETIERYEKALKLADRRLVSMCGKAGNPRIPRLEEIAEIYSIIRKALD